MWYVWNWIYSIYIYIFKIVIDFSSEAMPRVLLLPNVTLRLRLRHVAAAFHRHYYETATCDWRHNATCPRDLYQVTSMNQGEIRFVNQYTSIRNDIRRRQVWCSAPCTDHRSAHLFSPVFTCFHLSCCCHNAVIIYACKIYKTSYSGCNPTPTILNKGSLPTGRGLDIPHMSAH